MQSQLESSGIVEQKCFMFLFNTWLGKWERDGERHIGEREKVRDGKHCPVTFCVPIWSLCTMQCLSSMHNFGAAFSYRGWPDISWSHTHRQDCWGGVLACVWLYARRRIFLCMWVFLEHVCVLMPGFVYVRVFRPVCASVCACDWVFSKGRWQ